MLSPFEFLDDVHQQITRKPQQAQYIYERARDSILSHHKDAVDCAAALFDAATSFFKHPPVNAEWQVLINVRDSFDKSIPSTDEMRHRRALLSLVAIWSSEIVCHYGWADSSRATVELLRQCALAFPDFQSQIAPLADYIMVHRHEESLFNGRVPSIGEHHSSSKANFAHSPLTASDIRHIAFIAKHGNNAAFVAHGVTMHAKSAHSPDELERQQRWCGDDSRLEVRGKALITLRPMQTDKFLLGYDHFGILVPKKFAITPVKRRKITARTESRLQDGSVFPTSLDHQAKEAGTVKAISKGRESEKGKANQRKGGRGSKGKLGRRANAGSRDKVHDTEQDTPYGNPSGKTQAGLSNAPCHVPTLGSETRADSGLGCYGKASVSGNGLQSGVGVRGRVEINGHGTVQLDCRGRNSQNTSPAQMTNVKYLVDGPSTSRTIHYQSPIVGDNTNSSKLDLNALDLATESIPKSQRLREASIDHAIRRRHFDLVKAYTDRVREYHDDQPEYRVRKAWLRPATQWAKIYASPGSALGHGESAAEDDADVVYISGQEFLQLSQHGKSFLTPVVIKEKFADAGLLTLAEFASLLLDRYRREVLQVRALGQSTTESMNVSAFVEILRGADPEPGSQHYGLNALDFHGITACSRPAFTHLLRYRLLETLSEAAIKDGPSKRISRGGTLIPFDISGSLAFNILGLNGAFSPPHVDALTGTWVRNLCGIKLWMIVPTKDMSDSDWSDFCEMGSQWEPSGKERLIVLEPDDVLLMPPGVRVIHAVHTPESSLMEGGMIWDESNILNTLSLLDDIHQHQRSTNESVPYQLYNIVAELETMVQADHKRFTSQSRDFMPRFESVIEALKQNGCDCGTSNCNLNRCPCSLAARRCTRFCSKHTLLPPRHKKTCMKEIS